MKIKDFFSFSIQKKIFTGFAIIILMVLTMMLLNYPHLNHIKDISNEVQPYSSQMYSIQEFTISLSSLESDMDKFFLIGGEIYKENILQYLGNMLNFFEEMEAQSHSEANAFVEELEKLVLEMKKEINNLLDITSTTSNVRETNEKIILVYSQIEKSKELLNKISTHTLNHLHDNVVEQNKSINSVVNQTLTIGVAVSLLGFFSSLLLARIISNPIKKLTKNIDDISMGKLDVEVTDKDRKDEIGALARAFDRTIVSLKIAMKMTAPELKKESDELKKALEEKEKTEVALRDSEKRYNIVTKETGQMIYDYDLKSANIFWAGAIQEITGYTPQEFKLNFDEWGKRIHPSDRDNALKLLQTVQKEGKRYECEYRFRVKDGTYKYIRDSGVFIKNEEGIVYRMLGVMTDITERKKAEEEIKKRNKELERFNKLAVDRELRMVELKKKIKE